MYEVLGRRFRRALEGRQQPEAQDDDAWALPDLIVIDGGKGQLSRVIAAVNDLGVPLGVEGIDVVSLAKERKGMMPLRPAKGATAAPQTAPPQDVLAEAPEALPGKAYEDRVVAETFSTEDLEIRPERVFVPGIKDPIILKPGSSERYLMERIRDEA